MKKFKIILLILFLGIFLTGCKHSGVRVDGDSDQISVVTTFFPIYDFTKNIIGNTGEVTMLLPVGAEPHDFEPSIKDLTKISRAKVLIYNSRYLETWVRKNRVNFDQDQVTTIDASTKVDLLPLDQKKKNYDPHTWLSPKQAIKEVEYIERSLEQKFPHQKKQLQQNGKKYLQDLKKLDLEYQQAFENAQQKKFITQHAAFSYLANDYHLEQKAIADLSAEEEPSPKRLVELKDYVQKNGLNAIYFEENASPKVAKTLAQEAKTTTLTLNPLESVSKQQQDHGASYLSIMRENLKSLQKTIN